MVATQALGLSNESLATKSSSSPDTRPDRGLATSRCAHSVSRMRLCRRPLGGAQVLCGICRGHYARARVVVLGVPLSKAAPKWLAWGLTIHSSRSRFAARLDSGVRPHDELLVRFGLGRLPASRAMVFPRMAWGIRGCRGAWCRSGRSSCT